MDELAKAFTEEPKEKDTKEASDKKPKEKDIKSTSDKKLKEKDAEPKKRKASSFVIFLIGLAMLITGLGFLAAKFAMRSNMSDAEKIVELGTFAKNGEEGVVWQFTEIGKGTLTTNGHKNDYDFTWAIEDGKLKIKTEWVEPIYNEYSYKIDGNKLILDDKIIFLLAKD